MQKTILSELEERVCLRGKSIEWLIFKAVRIKDLFSLMNNLKSNKGLNGSEANSVTSREIGAEPWPVLHSTNSPGELSKQVLLEHSKQHSSQLV